MPPQDFLEPPPAIQADAQRLPFARTPSRLMPPSHPLRLNTQVAQHQRIRWAAAALLPLHAQLGAHKNTEPVAGSCPDACRDKYGEARSKLPAAAAPPLAQSFNLHQAAMAVEAKRRTGQLQLEPRKPDGTSGEKIRPRPRCLACQGAVCLLTLARMCRQACQKAALCGGAQQQREARWQAGAGSAH